MDSQTDKAALAGDQIRQDEDPVRQTLRRINECWRQVRPLAP
jgi:hypothetical protein